MKKILLISSLILWLTRTASVIHAAPASFSPEGFKAVTVLTGKVIKDILKKDHRKPVKRPKRRIRGLHSGVCCPPAEHRFYGSFTSQEEIQSSTSLYSFPGFSGNGKRGPPAA